MQPLRVLIHDARHAAKYAELLRNLGCSYPITTATNAAELAAALPEADVLIGTPAGLPPGALSGAGHLRLVQGLWAGVEGWLPTGLPASVPLVRMTRIFQAPIAEYVFGHLLALNLQLARLRANQAERRWEPFAAETLAGKTMGIAGGGDTGGGMARGAAAFDWGGGGRGRRRRAAAPPVERYFSSDELAQFLPELDYLVLVLPKTGDTRALFDAGTFARMKRGARLVNVGRGHAVDEGALAEALRTGQLGAAVLDVFQTEPLPIDSPLWGLPNAVITPHNSGITQQEPAAVVVWENLQHLLRGEPLPGLVDRAAGY